MRKDIAIARDRYPAGTRAAKAASAEKKKKKKKKEKQTQNFKSFGFALINTVAINNYLR